MHQVAFSRISFSLPCRSLTIFERCRLLRQISRRCSFMSERARALAEETGGNLCEEGVDEDFHQLNMFGECLTDGDSVSTTEIANLFSVFFRVFFVNKLFCLFS